MYPRRFRKNPFLKIPGKLPLVFLFLSSFLLLGFLSTNRNNQHEVAAYYRSLLDSLQFEVERLYQLTSEKAPRQALQEQFRNCRKTYKQLAVLSEFFNPYETKFLNGPALNRVEEDNPDAIIPPHGFQLVEEYLFGEDETDYNQLQNELRFMADVIARLKKEKDLHLKFKDELVFEALRSSVLRLMALGISGFDSPVAQHSLQEGQVTLHGIKKLLALYEERILKINKDLYASLTGQLAAAQEYLLKSRSFDSFDRLHFIKTFANPIYAQTGQIRDQLSLPPLQGRRPLRQTISTPFDSAAFDISFFSPDEQYQVTPERVALGKKLFYDPILSQTKTRSCGSCHQPELTFTDGLRVPVSLDNQTLLTRNTPGLWNSVLQTRQFYDSRADALENQLDEVVHNADEMKGSLKQSVEELKQHPEYLPLFKKAYANDPRPVTAYTIANAISCYVRSLVALNSRFDRYMRNEQVSLSADEKKGFNLFMGKAKCGTCHFLPLFNGLVPPDFMETESEVLGVPAPDKKTVDPDPGKFNFTTSAIHRYAFKTPTLRNIELTAPYMHNGVYRTLEEVMDFYNKGGGAGLGFQLENQTLPAEKLGLSKKEQKQIIAFLKTLTDTSGAR